MGRVTTEEGNFGKLTSTPGWHKATHHPPKNALVRRVNNGAEIDRRRRRPRSAADVVHSARKSQALRSVHHRLQLAHRGLPNHLGDTSKKEIDTAVPPPDPKTGSRVSPDVRHGEERATSEACSKEPPFGITNVEERTLPSLKRDVLTTVSPQASQGLDGEILSRCRPVGSRHRHGAKQPTPTGVHAPACSCGA